MGGSGCSETGPPVFGHEAPSTAASCCHSIRMLPFDARAAVRRPDRARRGDPATRKLSPPSAWNFLYTHHVQRVPQCIHPGPECK